MSQREWILKVDWLSGEAEVSRSSDDGFDSHINSTYFAFAILFYLSFHDSPIFGGLSSYGDSMLGRSAVEVLGPLMSWFPTLSQLNEAVLACSIH
jgi:hypothetical protein